MREHCPVLFHVRVRYGVGFPDTVRTSRVPQTQGRSSTHITAGGEQRLPVCSYFTTRFKGNGLVRYSTQQGP